MYIYLHQAEDNLFVSPCESPSLIPSKIVVNFFWIPGHRGISGNTTVDRFARWAVSSGVLHHLNDTQADIRNLIKKRRIGRSIGRRLPKLRADISSVYCQKFLAGPGSIPAPCLEA